MRWSKRTRSGFLIFMIVALTVPIGMFVKGWMERRTRAEAVRWESAVRELIKDEPLANVSLRPHHDGMSGFIYLFGIEGPQRRRGETALVLVNPLNPKGGLARAAGATIDACRTVPDGVPADLFLSRKVLVPDVVRSFGQPSSRSIESVGRFKDVEFCTYGFLDVGIKDGVLVIVRVR